MVARFLLLAALAQGAAAEEVKHFSLRLGGREIELAPEVRGRAAGLAREMFARCGPNTLRHPGNFGLDALRVEQRSKRVDDGSRLHVVFAAPFVSESHLGGTLGVSEAIVGLEQEKLFVGPNFTRHGGALVEHLQCEYLPALELACLPALAPYLPAGYRETCARLERDAAGRIVMPPPDIAPSCS
jgi:hypothetical protein